MLWFILIALWSGWVAQAVLAAVMARKFASRLDYHESPRAQAFRPPAAVIVPFKGLEPSLADNIKSLCEQNYPDYQLVCVFESEDDPAYTFLRGQIEAASFNRAIHLVIAGQAPPTRGQKVHNQLQAIAYVQQQQWDEQVWVFADSDAVPGPDWLARMVGPLSSDDHGLTTGYRWLVPEPDDTGRITCWSHFASIWNSSVAGFLGREKFNHAWGGSMALRVETAQRGNMVQQLSGALTDDYPLTLMCRELGMRVRFVPACLVLSPTHFTFRSLLNFMHRQYLLTRVYVPSLYYHALWLTLLNPLAFGLAWVMFLRGLDPRQDMLAWLLPLTPMVVVFIANQIRASLRCSAIRKAFGAQVQDQLRTTLLIDRWLTPLTMALHFLMILRAALGRTMTWRGIRYRINGPDHVRRLD